MPTKTLDQQLWARINKTAAGCWIWTGAIERAGYGVMRRLGKSLKVHRVVYQLAVGPIPDGLQLDHLCRNRACCNPRHLEAVTGKENVRRGEAGNYQKVKTHCSKGHEFTSQNTYYRNGSRQCRTCNLHYTHLRRGKIDSGGKPITVTKKSLSFGTEVKDGEK